MDDVAMTVAHDLEFDMPRAREILLDVYLAISERGQRFRSRELKRPDEIVQLRCDSHAHAATAGSRLDYDGKPDITRKAQRFFRILDTTGRTWHDRHIDGCHRISRGRLVAHDA